MSTTTKQQIPTQPKVLKNNSVYQKMSCKLILLINTESSKIQIKKNGGYIKIRMQHKDKKTYANQTLLFLHGFSLRQVSRNGLIMTGILENEWTMRIEIKKHNMKI